MPRNNGVFTLLPGYFVVDGQVIQPSQHNPPLEDIAQALTGSVPRDGTAGMQAPFDMGGFRIINVAAGTTAGDVMRYEQGVLRSGSTMTGELILFALAPTSALSAGYRGSPPRSENNSYTLGAADNGWTISHNSGTAHTYTIPPVSSGDFVPGTMINMMNEGTGVLTIAPGSGVTLRWSPVGSTGNRTLAQYGWASIYMREQNSWWIAGAGVS